MNGQQPRGTPTRAGELDPSSRLGIFIRPLQSADAAASEQIGFEAHGGVAVAHNVPSEQPSLEFAISNQHNAASRYTDWTIGPPIHEMMRPVMSRLTAVRDDAR
jgi:hypothetical protein